MTIEDQIRARLPDTRDNLVAFFSKKQNGGLYFDVTRRILTRMLFDGELVSYNGMLQEIASVEQEPATPVPVQLRGLDPLQLICQESNEGLVTHVNIERLSASLRDRSGINAAAFAGLTHTHADISPSNPGNEANGGNGPFEGPGKAPAPQPKSKPEVVAKAGIVREMGWLYYVTASGCVARSRMVRPRKKQNAEQLTESLVKRDRNFIYFINDDGDIARLPRSKVFKKKDR